MLFYRNNQVADLLYPLCTVLDDSIGCAVWFAARGQGILGNGPHKGHPYCSHAKVTLEFKIPIKWIILTN